MCSLRQNGQYVSDGPFLIAAVLNGELEGELRLFALHQLQTTLRVNVLDGATLKGDQESDVERETQREGEWRVGSN